MKNIIINNKSEISAEGNLNCFRCKPVICITTGHTFTSVTDAAEYAGCVVDHMVRHLKGQIKMCKGKEYCYLNEASEHLEAMTARLRALTEMEADANRWRAQEAEQEAIRLAEEKHLADIAKAEEEAARYKELADKYYQKRIDALNNYDMAIERLRALRGE